MSKGNQIIPVRFSGSMLDSLREEILKHNSHSTAVPMSMSDFIRRAVSEKIEHRRRGRSPRRKIYEG